jgi:hypothetical protein
MANTYLTRTFGTPTNNKIWTCSAWLKRANSTNNHSHLSTGTDTSNRGVFYFNTGTSADFQYYEASGGSAQLWIQTNQQFRDYNGWYHIVVSVDTTQATASNRWKLYVNGEQVTSFGTATYPSQNYDTFINKASARHDISGRNNHSNSDFYWEGAMSHYHFIDGTAYDATAFGQYDANGVWTIKTSPSVTYGTNGFFILKNGNSVTDQSGNSNNFTVAGGTLTNTEDSPSNVFATLNFLNGVHYAGLGFSNGNNSITTTAGQYAPGLSTLGVSTGKWYGEFKMTSSSNWSMVGVTGQVATATDYSIGHGTTGYGYTGGSSASGQQSNNNSLSSYGDTYNNGDIIGIALDLDNNKLYFSKNGTWQNSGDPTSGATGTGAISISASPDTGFYHMGAGNYSGTQTPSWSANFGNGYFGTTAVASAGTNASGIGIFEYDVPTGYTALSTKGLNL